MYANHDDDPAALARDARVRGRLADIGMALHTSKDHVVFERDEVLTQGGNPYSVFTPYKNAWLKKLDPFYLKAYPVAHHAGALAALPATLRQPLPTLADIGFEPTNLHPLKLPSGSAGGAGAAGRLPGRAHRPLPRDARLPGRQGPELPEHAPALRHGVDPPPGARGLAAHACRAGHARRAGLAVAS